MKTILICHEGALLDQEVLARWLNSFSDFVGLILLREPPQRVWRRVRREIKRVGFFRFLDVLAFVIYYKLFLERKDRRWERQKVEELCRIYPQIGRGTSVLRTFSPNTKQVEHFVEGLSPDLVLVRCKTLLKENIFSIPAKGSFVMHPGICPEYRNAHGCFWALVRDDLGRVGMTLLRIDKGVDTGPVFGHYGYRYDERESHIVIQHRTVLENLDLLATKFLAIFDGSALPINTFGRCSATWGQPWLTKYLTWKYRARRRANESCFYPLP
jgi:hypothetical protein